MPISKTLKGVLLAAALGAVCAPIVAPIVLPARAQSAAANGISIDNFELVELNEAFAAQAIACIKELGLPGDRTNIYGGGISLGHPIGATGARIVATLIHGMKRSNRRLGLATLCIGGGQGMAMILESAS